MAFALFFVFYRNIFGENNKNENYEQKKRNKSVYFAINVKTIIKNKNNHKSTLCHNHKNGNIRT